jgi:hypothetical protein
VREKGWTTNNAPSESGMLVVQLRSRGTSGTVARSRRDCASQHRRSAAYRLFQFVGFLFLPQKAPVAENLFLRRQLALYKGRDIRPRRVDFATRISLAACRDWRDALVVVRPETIVRWHRAGLAFAQNNDVIRAMSPDAADQAFNVGSQGLRGAVTTCSMPILSTHL